MKLPKLSQLKRRPLGERGIAHFAAPLFIVLLVGLVGTYMLVASHAGAPKSEGQLIVYGGVDYTGFDVQAVNLNTNTHSCRAKWSDAGKLAVPKKLPKPTLNKGTTPPSYTVGSVVLHCTPTKGLESYHIQYMTGAVTNYTEIAVDVDANACTYVHPDGRQEKSALTNGKCGYVDIQKITARDAHIQVKLTAAKNKITGWVDFTSVDAHKLITKDQCTGQVAVTLTKAPATVVDTVNLPLKFVPATKAPKPVVPAYCVAKLNFTGLKKATLYNVTANFAGSAFFNPTANGLNATTLN